VDFQVKNGGSKGGFVTFRQDGQDKSGKYSQLRQSKTMRFVKNGQKEIKRC